MLAPLHRAACVLGVAATAATLALAAPQKPKLPRAEVPSAAQVPTYAWDSLGARRMRPGTDPRTLPRGEAPIVPDTVLYLSGNADLIPEVGGPSAPVRLGLGFEAVPAGRFAGALASPGGRAGLELQLSEPVHSQFSLSFWIRPRSDGQVLSLPGLLALSLNKQLQLTCRLQQEPTPDKKDFAGVRPGKPLARDAWNFVSVMLDRDVFERAALIIDDDAMGLRDLRPVPTAAGKLVLGTSIKGRRSFEGDLDDIRIVARPLNSAELIELAHPLERRGARRLALSMDPENAIEYPDVWLDVVTKPRLESESDWRLGAKCSRAPSPTGLRWVTGQWRRDSPLVQPTARTTQPTVFVGDHTIFIFSGEVRDSHVHPMLCVNDTWLYHLDEERWEEVPTPDALVGRVHQMAAYSPDHDVVLMHGGWINEHGRDERLSDTWLFDVSERRWRQVAPAGDFPGACSDTPVVYDPVGKVFRLILQSTCFSFDPATESWTESPPAGVSFKGPAVPGWWLSPSGTAGYDPVGKQMVYFGGHRGGGPDDYEDDTVHYDPVKNHYTLMDPEVRPSNRGRAGFAYHPGQARFVLFGGVLGQRSMRKRDLWAYTPATGSWEELESADRPTRRGGFYNMAYDPELDEFALVCGRHDVERFQSDVYRLRLDPAASASVRYTFDRESAPDAQGFDVRWKQADDFDLDLAFRGSSDGLRWGDWHAAPAGALAGNERYLQFRLETRSAEAPSQPLEIHGLGFTTEAPEPLDPALGRAFPLR